MRLKYVLSVIVVLGCIGVVACVNLKRGEHDKTQNDGRASSVVIVNLYLGDGVCYPVELPAALDVSTDYATYISAKDGSLSISVLSGVNPQNLNIQAAILNSTQMSTNVIAAESVKKGLQEAAAFIFNDKGIVVRAYGNPEAYETVLYGILNNVYTKVEADELVIDSLATRVLTDLPEYSGFDDSTVVDLGNEIQRVYTFRDDTLTITKEVRKFEDAVTNMSKRLTIVVGDNIARKVYKTGDVYYVEMKEYTIAVMPVNYNTSITLFGIGEESRYNIVKYIKER